MQGCLIKLKHEAGTQDGTRDKKATGNPWNRSSPSQDLAYLWAYASFFSLPEGGILCSLVSNRKQKTQATRASQFACLDSAIESDWRSGWLFPSSPDLALHSPFTGKGYQLAWPRSVDISYPLSYAAWLCVSHPLHPQLWALAATAKGRYSKTAFSVWVSSVTEIRK